MQKQCQNGLTNEPTCQYEFAKKASVSFISVRCIYTNQCTSLVNYTTTLLHVDTYKRTRMHPFVVNLYKTSEPNVEDITKDSFTDLLSFRLFHKNR